MNLKRALRLEDEQTKKQRADEKRRRLSYLKAKHQEQHQPSEARAPRPKPPRPSTAQMFRKAAKTTKKALAAVEKQAKKMPSNTEMDDFVWGKTGKQK